MSKTNQYSNNEIRTGFLVTFCGLVLLVLLFMSGKSQLFEDVYDLNLRFNYISGLKENAPVHLAGHEIGKVSEINFTGGEEPNVNARITIRSDAVVREDSDAFINILGFMGETYIELSPGTRTAQKLEANASLVGTDPIPMMEIVKRGTKIMDELETSMGSLNNVLDSATVLVDDLSGIVDNNQDEIDNIFGNLDSSTENLNDMTADLKTHPWKLLRKPED